MFKYTTVSLPKIHSNRSKNRRQRNLTFYQFSCINGGRKETNYEKTNGIYSWICCLCLANQLGGETNSRSLVVLGFDDCGYLHWLVRLSDY